VSQRATFSMEGDHAYRLFSQTDSDGAGNDGSLNAPTGIPNRVEPVSRVQQTVTPQVGQKWWLIRVPALLVRVYILLGPSRRTVSLGKYALLVHGTPDRRWQSRQWHTLTTIGSAETLTLKAPHRHSAVLGIFVVSSDLWSNFARPGRGRSFLASQACTPTDRSTNNFVRCTAAGYGKSPSSWLSRAQLVGVSGRY
jgi:hypothetical protein